MPSGPGVLFNSDYPDGDVDANGEVKPEAKEALLMWSICFFLMEAASQADAEVMIEQPVWRGAGPPHAIPGKEWHTTIFHTSIGKNAVNKMELKGIPFDQGAEPINAPTQKTTSLWSTPKVFPLVMNKFGSLKMSIQTGSLNKPRVSESGAFSTAGSEEFTSTMCKMLAEVAQELLKTRRSWAEIVSTPPNRLGNALEAEQLESAIRASAPAPSLPITTAPASVSAHGWEFEINARDASTSMVDPSKFKWKSKPVHILLDSCSDAHIFCDRDAFITYLKSGTCLPSQ